MDKMKARLGLARRNILQRNPKNIKRNKYKYTEDNIVSVEIQDPEVAALMGQGFVTVKTDDGATHACFVATDDDGLKRRALLAMTIPVPELRTKGE